ncbi:unnamed protein product [Rotaria sp. Silwood1]|nr:unnamed protein product [Rotaria sp. Silwood1]
MIKNIIDYHLSSDESMTDDSLNYQSLDSSDNLTTTDYTASYLLSMNNDHYKESTSRNAYTLDEDDILTDDIFQCQNDLSLSLYDNARISVRNATVQLMDFIMESNLNKSTVTKLFRLVKSLLPLPNKLPTTHTQIFKVLGRVPLFQSRFYCNGCNQLCIIRNNKKICDNRNCSFSDMPLKSCDISEVVDLDIPSQIKTIINRNSSLFFDQHQLFPKFDIPYGEQYRSVTTPNKQKLTLIIHADGAPLVREFQSNILVLAMWASCQKPNVDLLMQNCISQLLEYETNDLQMVVNGRQICINIRRQMFIADLPAKCIWKGQILYPYAQKNNRRRVHKEVLASGKEAERRLMPVDGIKGVSSMLKILTYPDQIICDYMHLVCLGHMTTLINRWLPLLHRSNVIEIDTILEALRLPHNINVIFNHSISNVCEWHAKHSRLFVLNIGLPCITLHLPKINTSHFAVYCLAIRFLHCPKSHDEINLAESLIDYYCRAAPQVFDDSIELLSLHAHLHLGEQVKRHGGLGFSSAFCFESCIRHLKKMVHGTKNLASQVAYWCDLRTIVPRPEFRLQKPTGKTKISITSSHINEYRSILSTNLLIMTNIYQKLYKTSRRDKSSSEEYAFITYLEEPGTYSIVKANRLIDIDSNNNGTIKDNKGSYRIQVVEKGSLVDMEEAARMIEEDPKLSYEMHENVVSDCDECILPFADSKLSSMKQIEFCSNERQQFSASSEVSDLQKESSVNTRTAVHLISDDDSSDDNDIEENEKNDNVDIMMSCLSTSAVKKKRSSSSNKNKSGCAAAKRIRFDDSRVSINIDETQLDISQILNYMKELNENNKNLLKQQQQVMLTQDRIEKRMKLISKNQKKIAKAMNQRNIPVVLDVQEIGESSTSQPCSKIIFIRSDGVEIDMMSIQCSLNNVNDYVNKAVDLVFKDSNELIALDPRKGCIDQDPRVKAIRDGAQAKYKLDHSEIEAIWPTLHECLLLKRRNIKKKVLKEPHLRTQDNSSNIDLQLQQRTTVDIDANGQGQA